MATMTNMKIKLCDPASYGCMSILADPGKSDESIMDAIARKIETITGDGPDAAERRMIEGKIAAARAEL